MKTRLKELRKKIGLSQTELAEKVGATQRQIGLWESGGRYSFEYACKLAKVLGCKSLDELAGGEWLSEDGKDEKFELYPDYRQELINKAFETSNEAGRDRLVEDADNVMRRREYQLRREFQGDQIQQGIA